VKETPTASAAGLTPKVLIPFNYKLLAMLFNHFSEFTCASSRRTICCRSGCAGQSCGPAL